MQPKLTPLSKPPDAPSILDSKGEMTRCLNKNIFASDPANKHQQNPPDNHGCGIYTKHNNILLSERDANTDGILAIIRISKGDANIDGSPVSQLPPSNKITQPFTPDLRQ